MSEPRDSKTRDSQPHDPEPGEYLRYSKMIDHALLTPTMSDADLDRGIELAVAYNVASICILPWYLKALSERLAGTTVKPSTVIGFPHGGQAAMVKVAEAVQAIADGGVELDMVVNISKVKSGRWDAVRDDIHGVVEATHSAGQKVKVIFENCYLEDDEKIRLCEICTELSADWVKTSTGFGTGGATMDDLRLMRKHAGDAIEVKAAGGVRTLEALREVRQIGASRCGASATAAILDPLREQLGMDPIEPSTASSGGY